MLLTPGRRTVRLHLAGRQLALPLVDALTGGLLLVMGGLTLVSAVRGPGMSNTGWQVRFTARITHAASQLEHQLAGLPGWAATGLVATLALTLVALGRRSAGPPAAASDAAPFSTPSPSPESALR